MVVQVSEILNQTVDVVAHLTRSRLLLLLPHDGWHRRVGEHRHVRRRVNVRHEVVHGPGRLNLPRHGIVGVLFDQNFAALRFRLGVGLLQPLVPLLAGLRRGCFGHLLAGHRFLAQLIAPQLLALTQIVLLVGKIFGWQFVLATLDVPRFGFVARLARGDLLTGGAVLVVAMARGPRLTLDGQ